MAASPAVPADGGPLLGVEELPDHVHHHRLLTGVVCVHCRTITDMMPVSLQADEHLSPQDLIIGRQNVSEQ